MLGRLPNLEVQMRGYTDNKQDLQRRLRRIEGQVRGLQRMVDEDAYCIDVLTQISAATKALQPVWCDAPNPAPLSPW